MRTRGKRETSRKANAAGLRQSEVPPTTQTTTAGCARVNGISRARVARALKILDPETGSFSFREGCCSLLETLSAGRIGMAV